MRRMVSILAASAFIVILSSPGVFGGYTEKFDAWSATSSDIWQVKDLSGYGVPANAVVEIAVINTNVGNEYWGGVRAYGSSLDRRFQLHEAESGGWDVVVMHVLADGSSRIEHYSDNTGYVKFYLLGYWDTGTYVERFVQFTAGASASWQPKSLSSYGVGANQVAEIVMVNKDSGTDGMGGSTGKNEAGVRTFGSTLLRKVDIHEAEGGGVDTATMLVTADASSQIRAYAEDNSNVDFYLVGYWSTPPETYYTEKFEEIPKPTSDNTWQDRDLSGYGVPANAVAEIVLANGRSSSENLMGVRRDVSSPSTRMLDLQEAERGGRDLGRMHVPVGASSIIQIYHEDKSDTPYEFRLVGYWWSGGGTTTTTTTTTTTSTTTTTGGWEPTSGAAIDGLNSYVDVTTSSSVIPYGYIQFSGIPTLYSYSDVNGWTTPGFYANLEYRYFLGQNITPYYTRFHILWSSKPTLSPCTQNATANAAAIYQNPPSPYIPNLDFVGYTPASYPGSMASGTNDFSLAFGDCYTANPFGTLGEYTYLIPSMVPFGEVFSYPGAGFNISVYYDADQNGTWDGNQTISVGGGGPLITFCGGSFDPNKDALEDAFLRLMDLLNSVNDTNEGDYGSTCSDYDGNQDNPVDIVVGPNLKVESQGIGDVPFMWGPVRMRFRVWG